ncbi:Protein of unknown function [Pyronema omphalodes CBS 100304]|uniref:Uncharacterized protein n=1 Tax=Pyronema omphalodes (strain CBS 100304) TaxID=1076935 RepID=U4KVY7_PYROM|nr:Protein of unknown function [Pyronema omphalodes CBS 100304]
MHAQSPGKVHEISLLTLQVHTLHRMHAANSSSYTNFRHPICQFPKEFPVSRPSEKSRSMEEAKAHGYHVTPLAPKSDKLEREYHRVRACSWKLEPGYRMSGHRLKIR